MRYVKVFLFFAVPDYEITVPYQSNEDGHFISHTLHKRQAGDMHDSDSWYYKMKVFGNDMHFKLRRNTNFVAPNLQLETRDETGKVTETPVDLDSYFIGKEVSDPDSMVAVSNNDGLVSKRCLCSALLFDSW